MFEEVAGKQIATGNSNAQADQGSNSNINAPVFNVNVNVPTSSTQAAIAAVTESSLSQNKDSSIWYVPYPRNPYFTGRNNLFQYLTDAFRTGKAISQVIHGLGGIGKTEAAIEYAFRYRNSYQAVLWARADLFETLISDFVIFASLLGLPQKDAQDQIFAVNAVKRWLESNSNWFAYT